MIYNPALMNIYLAKFLSYLEFVYFVSLNLYSESLIRETREDQKLKHKRILIIQTFNLYFFSNLKQDSYITKQNVAKNEIFMENMFPKLIYSNFYRTFIRRINYEE